MIKTVRSIRAGCKWFARAGAVLLLLSMLVSCTDVIGSKLFSWPFPGITEVVGYLQGMVIALAIAQTQISRLHIKVEFFTEKLPKRVLIFIDSLILVILFFLFAIIIWQIFKLGLSFQSMGDYSQTLRLPIHVIVYIMALALVSSCFAFAIEFLESVKGVANK